MFEEKKSKKYLTPQQALLKAQTYCAYQERSQQEVRNKLYEWGLYAEVVEETISKLVTDNFLNEERFAVAFAGGKFRIKKWGRVKIKIELKKKKTSEYCIRNALSMITDKDYIQTLKKVLNEKSKQVKEKNAIKRNYKIGQHAISKGFEPDLVWDILRIET